MLRSKLFRICANVEALYKSYSKQTLSSSDVDFEQIEQNLHQRRSKLTKKYVANETDEKESQNELRRLPNNINARLLSYGDKAKLVDCHFSKEPNKDVIDSRGVVHSGLRMEHLGNVTGHKSYYFKNELAAIEQALVRTAIKFLRLNNFKIVSVPDILNPAVIEGCGMSTDGERTQVYKLECDRCLSGTAEMALAGLFSNKNVEDISLPLKLAAVSRCYRAETSGLQEEKSIYRVHQFTKVEMFSICSEKQSEEMLESLKEMQLKLYKNLSINFRLLDMPPIELGLSAYQKYDIEAWLPSKQFWGEISSCSNCTDYQSRRLNIRSTNKSTEPQYVHTINGTAAAIPRLIMVTLDYKNTENVAEMKPVVMETFINEKKLKKNSKVPRLKLLKSIPNVKEIVI